MSPKASKPLKVSESPEGTAGVGTQVFTRAVAPLAAVSTAVRSGTSGS
ncbi:hypothetical protein ACFY7Z_18090 [Streptomyces sp. NPDC012623]